MPRLRRGAALIFRRTSPTSDAHDSPRRGGSQGHRTLRHLRATSENPNGLVRRYFLKRDDLYLTAKSFRTWPGTEWNDHVLASTGTPAGHAHSLRRPFDSVGGPAVILLGEELPPIRKRSPAYTRVVGRISAGSNARAASGLSASTRTNPP